MKYVIYAPLFNEESGGVIALYKLADLLNKSGLQCKVWHWNKIHPFETRVINGKSAVKFQVPKRYSQQHGVCPFNIPEALPYDINDAIVIYPEVVEGNPLGAKKIARWLLNRPGALTGTSSFSLEELTFYYQPHFLPDPDQVDLYPQLYIRHFPTDIYQQRNINPRSGTCHMVRKGKGVPQTAHPQNSIAIDGLPHQRVSEIFNTCEEFISYDLHTAYSVFAVLCGCKSIVVPRSGLSREQWKVGNTNNESAGIAYGREDLPRAIRTRDQLLDSIRNIETENTSQVESFISLTKSYFYA